MYWQPEVVDVTLRAFEEGMTLTHGILIGGMKASLASALVGAVFLAAIEGVGIAINRLAADQNKPAMPLTN